MLRSLKMKPKKIQVLSEFNNVNLHYEIEDTFIFYNIYNFSGILKAWMDLHKTKNTELQILLIYYGLLYLLGNISNIVLIEIRNNQL